MRVKNSSLVKSLENVKTPSSASAMTALTVM